VAALARREFLAGYLERATSEELPRAELERLGQHHLLDLVLPEDQGGQGADPITVGIACEQMAYADFNLAYLVFAASVIADIAVSVPDEIGAPLIRAVAAGDEVVAVALTEPKGGSDAARPWVRADPVEGGFVLHGEKTSVSLGMHAREVVVVASIDPSAGSRATRRFLVRVDGDPTVTRQRFRDPGFRPIGRAGITFDGTFVPAERQMNTGKGGGLSGIAHQLAVFDASRILLGLMVIGAARRALDMTIEWAGDRQAFGRPIAGFQGVSFTIAEHDTQLEAARWLCYRALGLRAQGRPHTREAAMCKWWAPRLAVQAINDCIVLHGHVGWSMEMPLQQMLLDVSGLQIGDGTPQIQKLVIARELMGRAAVG
jgi:cyclohexanecarboxyl-CoA dehydrogenase